MPQRLISSLREHLMQEAVQTGGGHVGLFTVIVPPLLNLILGHLLTTLGGCMLHDSPEAAAMPAADGRAVVHTALIPRIERELKAAGNPIPTSPHLIRDICAPNEGPRAEHLAGPVPWGVPEHLLQEGAQLV